MVKAKTKGAGMKKTPIQMVKEKFGSKDELVKILVGKLERKKDESKDDFEKRLKKVPAEKLMKLNVQADEVAALGGRQFLINSLHDFYSKGSKEDKDFKAGLEKRRTTGSLLDEYKAIQKRRRNAAK